MLFRAFLISGVIAVLTVSRALCCEHQVFVEKGSTVDIQSPGYDHGNYELNVHCRWNITTTSNAELKLSFSEFHIEYHLLCIWDYILVSNGTCGSGGDVKRYCGTSVPSNIFFKTAEACLEFHSDEYVAKPGFKVLVTSEELKQQVQSSTTMSTVQLSSIKSHTTSSMSSPKATTTTLIPNTTSAFSPPFPSPSQPSVQTLLMGLLVTDPAHPTVVEMCKDVTWYQAEHDALVISPGYAQNRNYGNNRNCHLKILNPGKKVLKFSFIDFNVEKHPTCFWDKLEVIDGQGPGSILATICGVSADTPDNLESSAEEINLNFTSDNVVDWKGFQIKLFIQQSVTPPSTTSSSTLISTLLTSKSKAALTSSSPPTITPSSSSSSSLSASSPVPIDPNIQTLYVSSTSAIPTVEMCNGTALVYSGAEGYILSPHYSSGNNYEINQDCVLHIINTKHKLIEFTFENFALEHHPMCSWDYLEFRAGLGAESSVLAKLCGETPSSPLTTPASVILVRFYSDSVNALKGFKIKYSISNAPTWLPTSPTVPTTSSLITTTPVLTTVVPTTTNHVTTPVPEPFTDNNLIILDNGLQQTFVKETAIVLSPNFGPGKTYPVSVTCGLKLEALNNRKIHINVLDFKVEYHPSCSWDRLSVYDGPSKTSTLIGMFCGVKSGVAINSSGTALFLEFVSDYIVPDKGFQLDISTEKEQSDDTTTADSTTKADLVTPVQLSSTSPTTDTSTLTSSKMNSTSSPTADDNVTTTASVSDQTSQLTSPSNLPPETSSTTDIQSTSTPSMLTTPIPPTTSLHMCNATNGMQILEVKQSADVFSPNFGNGKKYPVNTQCGLLIRSSGHQLLKMNITTLNMEHHSSCGWDSLRVYDGADINAPLLGVYCGLHTKTDLYSTSSKLYLLFQSDSIVTASGFHLVLSVIEVVTVKPTITTKPLTTTMSITTATTIPATTSLTTPSTTPSIIPTIKSITSPITIQTTTPSTMPSTISTTTPTSTSTTIQTATFTTVPTTTTVTTPTTKQTTKTTPLTIPTTPSFTPMTTVTPTNPFTLSTNTLSSKTSTTSHMSTTATLPMTVSTPKSTNAVTELCGGKTKVHIPAEGMFVTSPNYGLGNYPTNVQCYLTLNASQSQAISVEFIDMDIEENAVCSWDSLSVYDGPTTNSNLLLAKICGNAIPQPLQSSSNYLHFHFTSDNVIPRKGFKAKLTVIQDSPAVSTSVKVTPTPNPTSSKTTKLFTTSSLTTSSATQAATA
ncbi:cubilin-like, partial [Mizuhopecten yessoensis]|uniref:cubilin-like n=1 Tax=Mizuhopecten yessoensis TaxID=6573 RepID=UPI000B4573B3